MPTPKKVSITLASARIPLNSRHVRDPVIVQELDLSGPRHISKNDKVADFDTVVPTLIYADNVLPTPTGYKSVNFLQVASAISSTAKLHCLHTVSISPGLTYLYAYVTDSTNSGNNGHWFLSGAGEWEQIFAETVAFSDITAAFISLAIVNGRAFIYFSNVKCMEITAGAVANVTLTGITAANILGCFSSSGYLMLWDETSVYRSSLVSPVDFVPSSVTGAGSESPQDARGDIKLCKRAKGGFIIYTDTNCLYAQYSQDFRTPFIYSEMSGLAGISSPTDVSQDGSQEHLIKSGANFSALIKSDLTTVFHEVTALAAAKLLDTLDLETVIITEEQVYDVSAGLAAIAGGILACSYRGITEEEYEAGADTSNFSHALIYLNSLGRYGKVATPHAFCRQWPFDTAVTFLRIRQLQELIFEDFETQTIEEAFSRESFGRVFGNSIVSFIAANGSASLLWDDVKSTDSDGVVVLGPFQMARGFYTLIAGISAKEASGATCYIGTSNTGETVDRSMLCSGDTAGLYTSFPARVTGANHLICFSGQFDLSSAIVKLLKTGMIR